MKTYYGTLYGSNIYLLQNIRRGKSSGMAVPGVEIAVWDTPGKKQLRGFRIGDVCAIDATSLHDTIANLPIEKAVERWKENRKSVLSQWDGGGWAEGAQITEMDVALAMQDVELCELLEHHTKNQLGRVVGVVKNGKSCITDPEYKKIDGINNIEMPRPTPEPITIYIPMELVNWDTIRGH